MADRSAAEHRKLHPFFTTPKPCPSNTPSTITTTLDPSLRSTASGNVQHNIDSMEDENPSPAKPKKRKSTEPADEQLEDTRNTKRSRGRPRKVVVTGPSIMTHFSKKNGDVQDDSLEQPRATAQADAEMAGAATNGFKASPDTSKAGKVNADIDNDATGGDKKAAPKKMLLFNPKTGTIGSPPKPKEAKMQTEAKDPTTPPSNGFRRSNRIQKIASISYGSDGASRKRIGAKIDSITKDASKLRPTRTMRTRMSPRDQPHHAAEKDATGDQGQSRTINGSTKKEAHPFFTGKAKQVPAPPPGPTPAASLDAVRIKSAPACTRHKVFSATPFSPRKPRPSAPSGLLPQFGMKSLGLKTPGSRPPAWPSKGMLHIRGDDAGIELPHHKKVQKVQLVARKSKGRSTYIRTEEHLLDNLVLLLRIPQAIQPALKIDSYIFHSPPVELRLPQKHIVSGVRLDKRVLGELRNPNHPALARLRGSLVTTLSALDNFTCESMSWAQKYTPVSTVEVLQSGKEAFLLRDWLQAMKVLSVDTGDVKSKQSKPLKKKRKKNKDEFIVDSDDDADDMDEVSDPEEGWSPDKRGIKKTVIRTGDNAKSLGRLTNTVVISGPHGCGKTSAVYAIAKELDFEVFEINSGSRRSGKDILEKIGDMTRNHLVQHHQTEAPAAAIDEEEVAQDIKSGKQATMNSFFKPKATSPSIKLQAAKKVGSGPVDAPVKVVQKKTPLKNQKQSLILLDEVDILYEEDKQFWSTVLTLIAQSRRPFIMTCNDEGLVPLQSLSLHGIFRFGTPPPDLAVDRLLVVAACEGHALRRNAVEALYEARQQDLRACLMDLNAWCQIAVGDVRGGFEWIVPRWPKGRDIDKDGNVIRAVSEDTFVEGMGWLAHDVVGDETEQGKVEDELMQEVNDFWQMDLTNWHDSLDLPSWAASLDTDRSTQLRDLLSYQEFTDALSLADLSAATTQGLFLDEQMDCTHPKLTAKAREDFVSGRQLLDAPLRSTYNPMVASLPITLNCLARKTLKKSAPGRPPSKLVALCEADAISRIRRRATASSTVAALNREDFSTAFDVLAISEKEANSASSYLDPSVFDGTMRNIVADVAPYVRSIVAFEKELQRQRQKLSSLVSQGGSKRGRKTRAAHAALEGGSRSTVRRDNWFTAELNGVLVMRTAGEGWGDALQEEARHSPTGSAASIARGRRIVTDGSTDESGNDTDVKES